MITLEYLVCYKYADMSDKDKISYLEGFYRDVGSEIILKELRLLYSNRGEPYCKYNTELLFCQVYLPYQEI